MCYLVTRLKLHGPDYTAQMHLTQTVNVREFRSAKQLNTPTVLKCDFQVLVFYKYCNFIVLFFFTFTAVHSEGNIVHFTCTYYIYLTAIIRGYISQLDFVFKQMHNKMKRHNALIMI